MNLRQAIQLTTCDLSLHNIEDARLEAEVLLKYVLGLSLAQLYTQPEQTLTQEETENLKQLIERRRYREPTAYIVKNKEFYGLDFYIDHRVLIPRPETELLVEKALEYAHSKGQILAVDIGTGCGAIAISLALNSPKTKVYAIDLSLPSLEVARLNCEYHKISNQITLIQGNLLESLPEPVNLIVANLPYIRTSEIVNLSPEISKFEPRIALDGGEDGLNQIRQVLEQVAEKLYPEGCLLLEIDASQDDAVVSLIKNRFPKARTELIPDLNRINRVVKVNF